MAEDSRKNLYKNTALNTDEMRRRREEEGVSLRKQKRDEQVILIHVVRPEKHPSFAFITTYVLLKGNVPCWVINDRFHS